MRILRELGMEPFVEWSRRPRGLRLSAVANALDVGIQLVKDRVARMVESGVIVGYRLVPNLRHFGFGMTVYHLQDVTVPDPQRMSRLADVDGFVSVVWFLDSGLCINLSHATEAEGRRRAQLLARLVDSEGEARILYTIPLPAVTRELSDLDWRIIAALQDNARRPLQEVAQAVGVSMKTVRTRLQRMREEGSIDEFVALDLSRVAGVLPFQLTVWGDPGVEHALLDRFRDRNLAHLPRPDEKAYCDVMLRVFAFTPAEVQAIVREALAVPGVTRAEALVATGSWENPVWKQELMDRRLVTVS